MSVRDTHPAALAAQAKALAFALGFDRVGIATAEACDGTQRLATWLARGYAGAMHYLERAPETRMDPARLFEGAASVIVVGLVYDSATPPAEPGAPRISRYARGDDYHEVLLDRLRALGAALEARLEAPIAQRAYVDTGPVMERALAARAGLGWIGKNSCLIDPELGSYLFLGVLVTDLRLPPDAPVTDHCGSCRACLDACPTDAFAEPYVLDATRCIAYTTIEDPGPIPEPLREGHGAWVFGCDICQEVCPWNLRTHRTLPPDPLGLRERLAGRPHWEDATLEWLLALDEDAWRDATRSSAMRRSKHRGLLRNVLVAAGNSGRAELAPLIEVHAASADPLLSEHARWALARLASQ